MAGISPATGPSRSSRRSAERSPSRERATPHTSTPRPDAQQRSEALKERVYIASTALAVTIAYERHEVDVTVHGAAFTLLATVLGTLLAVFVADVVAHIMTKNALPTRWELAHMSYVSLGASGVVVVPMGILALSAVGAIDVVTALRAISTTLAVTLVVVTLLAVRRLPLGRGKKTLAVALIAALGLTALGIELAAH